MANINSPQINPLAARGNNMSDIPLNSNVAPGYDSLAAQFATSTPSVDVIWQPYYDTTTVASATAATYKFFQAPNTGGNYLSNLSGSNGRLAGDQAMLVKSIKFSYYVPSASAPVDVVEMKNLFSQMYFKFWCMNKPYYDNSGLDFIDPQAALVVNTKYYASQPFKWYSLAIPLIIAPNTSFYVETSIPSVTLAASINLVCEIAGVLYRGVQ